MMDPSHQASSKVRAWASSSSRTPRSCSPSSGIRPHSSAARPLRRAIQRHIEDSLSEKILYKEFSAGEIIVVDLEDDPDNEGKKRFTFTAVEGFVPPASVELATTATESPATPGDELPPPDAE